MQTNHYVCLGGLFFEEAFLHILCALVILQAACQPRMNLTYSNFFLNGQGACKTSDDGSSWIRVY